MEITPLKSNLSPSFPLPIYQSIKIGEAINEEGGRFFIVAGLGKEKAKELKTLSSDILDIELQNFTSDRERFVQGSYETWYAKDRTPFALIDTKNNALAAIVWFGPKPLGEKSENPSEEDAHQNYTLDKKEKWHTISYRCYPLYRGKHLMKDFAKYVMTIYLNSRGGIKLWAAIKTDNVKNGGLASSLGFKIHEKLTDLKNHRLVMIRE